MTTSLIVGCGYVGRTLARKLVERDQQVYAVTRTGVSIDGVESVEHDVTERGLDLPDADRMFYLVSPDERSVEAYREAYVDGLKNTIAAMRPDRSAIVYASSTGVYEREDGSWVDETTPIDPTEGRTEILLEAERIANSAGGTVVRFGGLYGPGRTGKERYLDDARVPGGYLNLIHRDDAASALLSASNGEYDRYISVDDEPVHRHELAHWLAEYLSRPVGELVETVDRSNKRCSNARLRSEGWQPAFPTFREGYRHAL
ncbi:MAG: NAD-dependent epimerase/dehydratase family protein [Halodesulfurarchaeum sp.]